MNSLIRTDYKPLEYASVGDIRKGYFFVPCKVNVYARYAGIVGRVRHIVIGGGEFYGAVKCKKAIVYDTLQWNRFIPKKEIEGKYDLGMEIDSDFIGDYKNIHDYWDFYMDYSNYELDTVIQTIGNLTEMNEYFRNANDDMARLFFILDCITRYPNFDYDSWYAEKTNTVAVLRELRTLIKDINTI